jgi:gas vesicle protein
MTDRETKEILKELKEISKLHKYVINDILEDSKDHNGETLQERLMSRLGDISHGCQSGTVGSLIYYSDTCAFFKKYKKEIATLVKEYQEETGSNISDLEWFDKEDIFCEEQTNQNYLAWFAYETIAFNLMNRLEEN